MKRPPGRPRTTPQPQPRPRGSVRADELLPLSELGRRLGMGHKTLARVQRAGLRTVLFGRMKYALGADVLAFFRRLAAEQDGGESTNGEGQQ